VPNTIAHYGTESATAIKNTVQDLGVKHCKDGFISMAPVIFTTPLQRLKIIPVWCKTIKV
jgi:hypothetical protein